MGEIRITAPGPDTRHWPEYMSNLLTEVVSSWVRLAETGEVAHHLRIGENQPTTEHLRIAKSFLGDRLRTTSVYETRDGLEGIEAFIGGE